MTVYSNGNEQIFLCLRILEQNCKLNLLNAALRCLNITLKGGVNKGALGFKMCLMEHVD